MSPLAVLYYVLPFLLAFLLHELEEAVTQHRWMKLNADDIKRRYPKFAKTVDYHLKLTTRAFVISAIEESIIVIGITMCLLVGDIMYTKLWMILAIAFMLHMAIHIVQGLIMFRYVPGLITAVIITPLLSVLMIHIYNTIGLLDMIIYGVIGFVCGILNLRFAYWLGMRLQ